MRTCKHLVEHLGKEYEDFRLRGVKGKGGGKRDKKAASKQNKISKPTSIKISLMLA
jgi:hypothetical protein